MIKIRIAASLPKSTKLGVIVATATQAADKLIEREEKARTQMTLLFVLVNLLATT